MQNKKPTLKKVPAKKKPAEKKERGRPQKLTKEIFDKIVNKLSFSELSLRQICKEVGITPQGFYNGLEGNELFIEQYARARDLQADYLFDLMREIVFDRSQDHTPFTGINVIQRDRLISDTIKWQASKLKPKKYGDKLEVEQKTELSGKIDHTITGMQIVNSSEPSE